MHGLYKKPSGTDEDIWLWRLYYPCEDKNLPHSHEIQQKNPLNSCSIKVRGNTEMRFCKNEILLQSLCQCLSHSHWIFMTSYMDFTKFHDRFGDMYSLTATLATENFSQLPLFPNSSDPNDEKNSLLFYDVKKVSRHGGCWGCKGGQFLKWCGQNLPCEQNQAINWHLANCECPS